MHRIYGAYLGNVDRITVELITELTEEEAIDLFLDQTKDRSGMSPSNIVNAALQAKKPEYVRLLDICTKNHVALKGNVESIPNPVGILTSISDGVNMSKQCPELLDRILSLIEKLQWNGSNVYEGKAYSAKVLRVTKKLYSYYAGRENDLEDVLMTVCKGTKYFNDNLMNRCQDSLFDFLSDVVAKNMDIIMMNKKSRLRKRNMSIAQ